MEYTQLKSIKMYEKALELMPGGVSSPVRALKSVGGNPLFIERANGAFLWDVDDNSYIDLCMSFGPLILGHANPNVISAVGLALGNGTSFGTSTPGEVKLAEKIVASHPSVDWIRFVNSGTEAVMSAIRLARGYTKRDLIIKFEGGYHGHADSMLVKAGSGLATFGISSSHGVTNDTAKNTIVLPLNDISKVKSAFEKYDNQIACVILEGVPANNGLLIQSRAFMQEVQKLCNENGTLFILDEVITGFRIGLGGATEYYDLNPDIVTLGKVIGGGLPIGAYGGRKDLLELMAPLGPVYQAGTLSGNPIAMAAGNATMDILMSNSVYNELEDLSESFESQTSSLFAENNIPLTIRRIGSIIWLILDSNSTPMSVDEISKSSVENYTNFHKYARQEGVYMPPSAYEVAFLSTAHNLSVIDDLISRLERVVKQL